MIEKTGQENIQRAQRYQVIPSEVVYSELFSEKWTQLFLTLPLLT